MKFLFIWLLPFFMFACDASKKAGREQQPLSTLRGESGDQLVAGLHDPVQEDRFMVYNAFQTIKVKEQEKAIENISHIVKDNNGYILEASIDRIRFRMPVDSLENILLATAQFGEVVSQNIHGQDVTEQHTDINLRLDNAKKSRQRYLQLLEKAEKVSDILLIEKELERLQYSIESLQGQLNKLNETITYSTVTITVQEKIKPGPIGWIFVGLYEGIKFLFVWE